MAQLSATRRDAAVSAPLPAVLLEVRQGARGVVRYELANLEFLIGSVPGCDLRLPGADLPPLFCLLTRYPKGLRLRKLAPTQLLLLNGDAVQNADLADGDRLTLGATDIVVHVSAASEDDAPAPELQSQLLQFRRQMLRFQEEREAFERKQKESEQAWEEKARRLDAEQRSLLEEKAKLESLRATAAAAPNIAAPTLTEKDLDIRAADILRQQQELSVIRQELADLRNQLYQRYQERRDRLSGLQEAVDRAGRKVQEQKRTLEAEKQEWSQVRDTLTKRQSQLDQQTRELEQQRRRFDDDRKALLERQRSVEEELSRQGAELERRETLHAQKAADLEGKARQYQADLVRLDRLQGTIDERERDLVDKVRAAEAQRKEIETTSAELEAQVLELESMRAGLQDEIARLQKQKTEQEAVARSLDQRVASLEGQQATLAGMRTRLERTRDDLREQEQALERERARQVEVVKEVEAKRDALAQKETELTQEQELFARQREDWSQRSAQMETAIRQMRQAQEQLGQKEEDLKRQEEELACRLSNLVDQEGLLQGRLDQIAQTQERLDAERAALRERTQAIAQGELTREALQESLRRRAEELTRKQEVLDAQADDLDAQAKLLHENRQHLEDELSRERAAVEEVRSSFAAKQQALDDSEKLVKERSAHHLRQFEQLQELGRQLAAQRKTLGEERLETVARMEELEAARRRLADDEAQLRRQTQELARQLPELELRAGTAADRLAQAREELRDHLNEVHEFVAASRRDLEQLGERLAADERRLRQEEQSLRQGQEEHRLALANFRQQLLSWQTQINAMKLALGQDQSRLEIRKAEVEEQAKAVSETSAQLAQKAEELQQHREALVERRQEVDEHLQEMRAWYRQKMRDLAGVDLHGVGGGSLLDDAPQAAAPQSTSDEDAILPVAANILALTDPGDRRLGDLLRDLDLVEEQTLLALLGEARRQRRSLRQVLLKSGAVTLYQLALIEAGNVAGLMLGPVRLIDRLAVLPHETLYRVFDPRRGREGLLRHLAEKDAQDPVRPDEFRQRFSHATLDHPHVAGAWETLDIAGRPAVLQEWLVGLASADWPPLAAAPGVCYRLLTQSALALAAIHDAGLAHGHLHEAAFLLTPDGTLKILGLGEPPWLLGKEAEDETHDPRDDLRRLGQVASGWCSNVRRGAKTKPLPDRLVSVLYRLSAETDAYPSAAALLEDLDRAGADVPPNAEAWERLLKYVKEHAASDIPRRAA
ncbi:MAG: hypothetical protein U0793_32165 [Gemmataceae bacterium]